MSLPLSAGEPAGQHKSWFSPSLLPTRRRTYTRLSGRLDAVVGCKQTCCVLGEVPASISVPTKARSKSAYLAVMGVPPMQNSVIQYNTKVSQYNLFRVCFFLLIG